MFTGMLSGNRWTWKSPATDRLTICRRDQVGLGLLGPGELVHRQIDLKPQIPDGVDDPLMGQGKGVKCSGEEGHPPGAGESEGAVVHPPQSDEAVDVGQGGRPVEEGEPIVLHRGLVDQEEELAVAQGKQPGLLPPWGRTGLSYSSLPVTSRAS